MEPKVMTSIVVQARTRMLLRRLALADAEKAGTRPSASGVIERLVEREAAVRGIELRDA